MGRDKSSPLRVKIYEKHMSQYNIMFRSEDEGFTIIVPSLPGCLTWAKTIEEGKILIKESIQAYKESVLIEGKEVQNDANTFFSSVYA